MKKRLEEAGLWCRGGSDAAITIADAWSILSRLGFPARYGGRAQDGSVEYVIVDPRTGHYLETGSGPSIEVAICDAALNARARLLADRLDRAS